MNKKVGLKSEDLKRENIGLILSTILREGSISRRDISKITGLTPAAVTRLTSELLEEELIVETGVDNSEKRKGGPSPILLSIKSSGPKVFGIQFGATKIRIAGLDLKGKIICEERFNFNEDIAVEKLIDKMFNAINKLTNKCNIEIENILGIGIGIAGIVDLESGLIKKHVLKQLSNLNLKEIMESKFNIPIYVASNVHAMTLAETWLGHGKTKGSFPLIFVGGIISCAWTINREIFLGHHQSAGQIGHWVVNSDGPLCKCGIKGCLEMYSSNTALERYAKEAVRKNPEGKLAQIMKNNSDFSRELVIEAYRSGDEDAINIVTRSVNYLAKTLADIIKFLDPEIVVLAGSALVGDKDETEINLLRENVKLYLPPSQQKILILPTLFGVNLSVVGAAALVIKEVYSPQVQMHGKI